MLMFCSNCGSKVEEGNRFCTSCGACVEETVAPVQEEPKYDEFVLGSTEEVSAKKKKAPKWVLPAAIAGVVAVIAAVFCIIFFGNSSAHLSGEAHLKKVTNEALGSYVDGLTEVYDMFLNPQSQDKELQGAKLDVSVRLGDELMDMLKLSMGQDIDLDWLNEIGMSMEMDLNDQLQKLDMTLLLSKQELGAISYIMDMANESIYLGLPSLSDTFLEFDMSGMGMVNMEDMMSNLESIMNSDELPDAKAVNDVLNRYIDVVLDNLPEVDKKSDKVSLGGLEQKCYVLTLKVNQRDIFNIAKAVLETAKDDEQLLDVVEGFGDFYNELMEETMSDSYGYGWTYVDFADVFESAIEDALDNMEDVDMDDLDDETLMKLVTYVDNKDNIIGLKMAVDEADMEIYYLTVTEDGKFCTEVEMGPVELEADGTIEKNILNGEYVLTVDGQEILELEVINLDQARLEKDEVVGKFVITPADALMDQMGTSMISDPSLSLDLNLTNEAAVVDVEVLMDGMMLVGINLSAESKENENIEIPNNTINGMDSNAMMEWAATLDLNSIIDNLEKAGVPGEYLGMLEDVLNQMG